jgi:hypothetical protein
MRLKKIGAFILNLLMGSLCVAAGHITNTNFNEMIEKTTTEQKKTASVVSQMAATEAGIQNYLLERPKSRGISGSF